MACRTTRPKRELVRIVRTPDGQVVVDATGRVAGRGAYLCADGSCRADKRTKGALERALGIGLPPGLLEELGREGRVMTAEGGARGQE